MNGIYKQPIGKLPADRAVPTTPRRSRFVAMLRLQRASRPRESVTSSHEGDYAGPQRSADQRAVREAVQRALQVRGPFAGRQPNPTEEERLYIVP